jgi:methylase of polypeptide subunit release factors
MLYQLKEILPADLWAGLEVERWWNVPEWAFLPDAWTHAFLRGLRKAGLGGSVWEVGCGSGVVSFSLSHFFPHVQVYFSDFDPRCTELAGENMAGGGRLPSCLYAFFGQWDLVTHQRFRPPKVDAVVACIPQVPAPKGVVLGEADSFAHYYAPMGREDHWNALGLGLNFRLLTEAKAVLNPGGRVILNLGGRPGLPRLIEMFRSCGYAPRVLHEEVIPQHSGTSLIPLASMEGDGHSDFEFFADVDASQGINARTAEVRRIRGKSLYHKIYVIEGATMA